MRKSLGSVACGNCGKMLPRSLNYVLCPPCWNIHTACKDAGVDSLAELADPQRSRQALMWRVASILRRSGVDDAEHLIRLLEHL